MADATLKDAMQTIRTRLVQMGKDAIPELMHSRDYVDVPGYGGNYPHCEVFPRKVPIDRRLIGGGARLTLNLEQWIWIEEIAAGYEGQVQEKAYWEILPECLQYFEEHRTLQYAAAPDAIPFYQDTNSGVVNADVTLQTGDDGVNALVLIFTWSIALDTVFPLRCG